MPVKVQCGECQKGLKVPEAARGKILKCPGCGAKVKVPGGKEVDASARKTEAAASDSAEILVNLDLKKVVDEDASICPQCGEEVYEDDEECGHCGFELAFGSVQEAKRAALEGRKTDLRPFYAKMIADALEFSKAHLGFIFFTWGVFVFASILVLVCCHLAYWCATWPTKSFWSFFGIVSSVVPIGWVWHFHTEIIRLTARKKKKIDKLFFDFAHSSMAGLTAVAWFTIFSLPLLLTLGLVGAYFTFWGDIFFAFPVAMVIIFLLISTMLPQAMSHHAMPITYRGWLMTEIFKTFGISFTPAFYWWFMAMISYLLPILVMSGIIFFSWGSLESYKRNFDDYTNLHGATVRAALKEKDKSNKKDTPKVDPLEAKYLALKPEPYQWTALILPFTGIVICSFMASFASVFNARSNGLYTYYLKNDLNLIQHVAERKYVKKEVAELDFSLKRSITCPIGARFIASLIDNLILCFIFAIIGGLAYFMVSMLQITEWMYLVIALCFAVLLNIVVAFMYYVAAYTGPTRTTPGKEIFNIFLVSQNGDAVSTGAVILRVFVLHASALLPLVNVIITATREDKRGWHDMAAGTVVRQRKKPKVKKKKEEEEEE